MNETQYIGPTVTPAADTPKRINDDHTLKSMDVIDALAVLACTQVRGKRNQVELKRRAQGVVDEAAERFVERE